MLNWLSRYAFVIGNRRHRRRPILDVGSGPYGVGFWTGEPFVGVDLNFEAPPHPTNFALLADAAALPFADAAFGEVILADLLEHVPPERRPAVIGEALRVAARWVYITFPVGEAARRADRLFAEYHRRVFGKVPGWVAEHESYPLPRPEELKALLVPLAQEGKLRFRILPGENASLHLLLTLVDHLPTGFSAELSRAAKADLFNLLRLFRAAAVGTPYRVNCVIELMGKPEPLLERLSAEPDLFRILACPVCRRGLVPEPDSLWCPWCGRFYRRTPAGIFNLVPSAPAADPSFPVAELKGYLGPNFEPGIFENAAEKVDAEFKKFSDPADFYRSSETYLYDLTLWDLSGAKAPGLKLIRALTFLDDSILDYGCGIGADGLRFIDRGFDRVSFADFDNPSTRFLKWRLERRGVPAQVYDIERDHIPRHRLVYAFDVIEHVDNGRSFLRTLEKLADIVVVGFLLDPPDKAADTVYPEYYRHVGRLMGRIRRDRCVLFDGGHQVEVGPGRRLRYRFMAWYSKPRPYLSVVIATYNRPADLERCLSSLAAADGYRRPREFEVVVVDDGSDPEPAAELDKVMTAFQRKLRLKFLRQPHRGLAAARNRGIRAARGHVLLFLNDDVTVPPETLEAHIRFHREHPELWVGMLGRVEWAPELEKTPIMDYVTGAGGDQFDFKGLVPGKEVDFWHFYGTCISVKRDFVLKTGEFFDPDFPALWDDIEWGYRLAARGLKVYYRPEAVVFHHHRVDTDYYVRRQELAGRMAVVFARKHPELAQRLLPQPGATLESDEIKALRAQVTLLEQAAKEAPELKPTLESLYGRLLEAAYRRGVAGALEKTAIPPVGEVIRRAEAAATAGRPKTALRLLKPLRSGAPEVRALYRLAEVLAGKSDLDRTAKALSAEEFAGFLFWLLKLGLFEEFDRVFYLSGQVWPDDGDRARALARIAAQAGRWEAAVALLEDLKAAGKAADEDLGLLSRAYIECGLVEAARVEAALKGAHDD